MASTPVMTPKMGEYDMRMLKLECLKHAANLGPSDAGDLIRKAAGIYRWVLRNEETPNE